MPHLFGRLVASFVALSAFFSVPVPEKNVEYTPPPIVHLSMPETVKAVYLTAETAGSKRLDEFIKLSDTTELNALVIDIQHLNGSLAFTPRDKELKHDAHATSWPLDDLEELTKKLHEHNIYAIARVVMFVVPHIANVHPEFALKNKNGQPWRDHRGLVWLDPANPAVIEHTIQMSREIYARGFDEINFDYIRYPSEGPVKNIMKSLKPKPEVMAGVFRTISETLTPEGIPHSIDTFAQIVWDESAIGIGQRFEDVWPYFDAIAPMVYPSHFANNFLGFANPAAHPREVVGGTARTAKEKMTAAGIPIKKYRPWLQAFHMGAPYGPAAIRAEIDETEKVGAGGWMLWNARNVYTETIAALKQEVIQSPK